MVEYTADYITAKYKYRDSIRRAREFRWVGNTYLYLQYMDTAAIWHRVAYKWSLVLSGWE